MYPRPPDLGVADPGPPAGTSIEEILEDFPGLTREDVLACIAYGSEMSRERYVDIPVTRRA